MAKFLTTKGIAAKIEDIIRKAKKKMVIVSPYLQISDSFFQRLKDADNSGIEVYIIYGKNELKDIEWAKFIQLHNVKLFFVNNLHAKCYFNETEMVITSMNFYEFSELNNIEMGISISRSRDSGLYQDAIKEVEALLQRSKKQIPSKASHPFAKEYRPNHIIKHREKKQSAACIRCQEDIPLNPDRPYCRDCFSIWAVYENYTYTENYCHRCGNPGESSMNKPLCSSCFFS